MTPGLAWAAGVFDGEGCVTKRHGKPVLQLKTVDRATVERFIEAVGAGHVLGPYRNRAGERDGWQRRDFYVWTVGTVESQRVLRRLWPWLGRRQRLRASEAGFLVPRGNGEGPLSGAH